MRQWGTTGLWIAAVALLAVSVAVSPGCATRICVQPTDLAAHIAAHEAGTSATIARTARMNAGEDLQILAISSGGQNGAFAAGVVNGWRRAERPDFHIITGVSIGALLGSFVFLDSPQGDALAKECFTTLSREDVVDERSKLAIPFVESVSKSDKLVQLLHRYFPNAIIDQVAARSENGKRLLLVSTTDLDCGVVRTWDMTALARERKYQLYRKVLLAAASIPLILPPVIINGEMYVDGGVCEQVFIPDVHAALASQPGADPLADPMPHADVYVIANSAFGSTAACVQPNLPDIWSRGLATLISKSLIGSLWHVYGIAQMRGFGFRMIHIPVEHTVDANAKMAFDTATMQRLYALGERLGASADSWSDLPPGIARLDGRAPAAPAPIEVPASTPLPTAVPPAAGGLPPPIVRSPAKSG